MHIISVLILILPSIFLSRTLLFLHLCVCLFTVFVLYLLIAFKLFSVGDGHVFVSVLSWSCAEMWIRGRNAAVSVSLESPWL